MFREYLKLQRFVRFRWRAFVAGIIFMVLFGIANGISLSVTVPLMDRVFSGKNIVLPATLPSLLQRHLAGFTDVLNKKAPLVLLKQIIVFIILIMILKGLFFYLQNYLLRYCSFRIIADLRKKIYDKLMNFSMDYFSKGRSGEMTTRIVYDVEILNSALSENFPQLFLKSFEAFFYLVLILNLDWKLSVLCFFLFPALLIPIFGISKKLRKLARSVQESYGKVGNIIQESVYGQQIIKSFNQTDKVIRKFGVENENIFRNIIAITKRTVAITPFTEIVATVGASGIIYYGARQVIAENMSSGFFVLFLVAMFSMISPLKAVGHAYANIKQASSALPRIFSVLEREIKVKDTGTKKMDTLKDSIVFDNISFAYADKSVLDKVSFKVARGEKIGIVGPTGVGKSTLIGLLLRFYDTDSGKILFDGEDIRSFTINSLRSHIGLVTQEPILFYDTIQNNISLTDNVDTEKLRRVADASYITALIESLPDKYETLVGERGSTLSGGQKQLLTIARAIYKDPPILILDEATASLDANSENLLQKALERVIQGRTVFIIAHRLSTLRNVDRIMVLKGGHIVEEGPHQDLLARRGLYYDLYQKGL